MPYLKKTGPKTYTIIIGWFDVAVLAAVIVWAVTR